jgi:hypothetical protein
MHTGRIFLGSKSAYLPVLQSARIEIGLNLKAAKALGIEVPTATPHLDPAPNCRHPDGR